MINRTNYNFKTLHRHPLTDVSKGALTYRTIQFSMSNRVLPPEKICFQCLSRIRPNTVTHSFPSDIFSKAFPNLGDKKPESRFNLFNSASQTFVIYTASFPESVPTVNSLLFTVFVVKNVIKIS